MPSINSDEYDFTIKITPHPNVRAPFRRRLKEYFESSLPNINPNQRMIEYLEEDFAAEAIDNIPEDLVDYDYELRIWFEGYRGCIAPLIGRPNPNGNEANSEPNELILTFREFVLEHIEEFPSNEFNIIFNIEIYQHNQFGEEEAGLCIII